MWAGLCGALCRLGRLARFLVGDTNTMDKIDNRSSPGRSTTGRGTTVRRERSRILLRSLIMLIVAIVVGAGGIALLGMAFAPASAELQAAGSLTLDRVGDIELPALSEPSKVYARDGALLAEFRAEIDRKPITLDQVPAPVQQAILAIEDDEFYEHNGVDLPSIGRALVTNVESGGVTQGGSTITQQVVKNTFLLDEDGKADQTLTRKAQEAMIALRLEREYSKEQILERYINTVYLGNGVYGFEAASRRYFGVGVGELSVADAALLSGLIASPAKWDPITKPEKAVQRRRVVLDRMVDEGFITVAERDANNVLGLPVELHQQFEPSTRDYFVEAVKQELLARTDVLPGDAQARFDQIFYGGLQIHTTLDPRLQDLATETIQGSTTLARQVERGITPDSGYTAAIASVDSQTGGVLALYGGSDFAEQKFNLASQGSRQTGSVFKIFGLVAALEQGLSPNDTLDGTTGCRYAGDRTGKRVKSPGGPMSLWQGTYMSINCVYVNLVNEIGAQSVVDTAHAMGIKSDLDAYGSIILGAVGVSPLETAAAFATLPSDGVRQDLHMITRVVDGLGNDIFVVNPGAEQVISANTAKMVTRMMQDVLTKGTAAGSGIGRPAAGKTGTTNTNADAWFVGFTPQITTAVWVGNPYSNNVITGQVGGRLPAAIWKAYMGPAHADLPVEFFGAPDLSEYRSGRKVGKFISGSSKNKESTGTTGGGNTRGGNPPSLVEDE